MSNVKAFVFDVFGTVVDWRGGVARDSAAFFAARGIHADPHAFADAWRALYQPAMEAVRSGTRGFVRLDVLHRENLALALPAFGIDPAAVPDEALDRLNFAWHRLDPWADAVPGIAKLRARHLVAPLSNGNVSLMIDLARRAGIVWDAVLGAEVARAYKPTPAAYLGAVEMLGVTPGQVCLVAAHNADLAAARACGLRTAFVARPTEHGAAQTTDLAAEADWDFVAPDFLALADMVGA